MFKKGDKVKATTNSTQWNSNTVYSVDGTKNDKGEVIAVVGKSGKTTGVVAPQGGTIYIPTDELVLAE